LVDWRYWNKALFGKIYKFVSADRRVGIGHRRSTRTSLQPLISGGGVSAASVSTF